MEFIFFLLGVGFGCAIAIGISEWLNEDKFYK